MPCQDSWHFEAIKLQASVHRVGADSTVVGGAFVGMMSAAHASTVHAATASSAAPQARSRAIRSPGDENHCDPNYIDITPGALPTYWHRDSGGRHHIPIHFVEKPL